QFTPSRSMPVRKAQPDACQRARAVAWHIRDPVELEILHRRGDRDPVADFGGTAEQLPRRQRLQGGMILPSQRLEHLAVQLLVHQKVAEPARRHDADAQIIRKVVDYLPNRRTEIEAARGAWLIGWVIGVEHDWHDGDR